MNNYGKKTFTSELIANDFNLNNENVETRLEIMKRSGEIYEHTPGVYGVLQ